MSWRLGWPWALSLFVACLLVLLPAGSGADVAVDADRAPQLVIMNGRVTDLLSGEAIVGARVAAGNASAETDSDGRYQIELVPGTHDLTIRAKGYIGVTYTAFSALLGSTTALDVQLTPDQPSPEVDALLASMRIHLRYFRYHFIWMDLRPLVR